MQEIVKDMTFKDLSLLVAMFAHKTGYLFDDIVDEDGKPFRYNNGDECSMFEKFQEDFIDFLLNYKRTVEGEE